MSDTFYNVWNISYNRWTCGGNHKFAKTVGQPAKKLTLFEAQDLFDFLTKKYPHSKYEIRKLKDEPSTVEKKIVAAKPVAEKILKAEIAIKNKDSKKIFPNFYKENGNLNTYELGNFLIERGFKYLGEGRHRKTYLSPNRKYVLKFPLHINYADVNKSEASKYRQFFSKPNPNNSNCYYAPCRMIDGHILMMRAMVEIYGGTYGCDSARKILGGKDFYDIDNKFPEWCNKAGIDMKQIGKTSDGRIMLYDYG